MSITRPDWTALPPSGKGFKLLSREIWHGGGYCKICGNRDNYVPALVRFYDPDDGWRTGVLCRYCAEDCATRGPQPDDYAVTTGMIAGQAAHIEAIASVLAGDNDGIASEAEDLYEVN